MEFIIRSVAMLRWNGSKSPKKTTTYDYKIYDHDDKELLISRKITVTDKNGVEIKEEKLKNDSQKRK
ncbi:hypothetical protein [Gabonibacter chumensis]|uniref:hypothetical protein n=1 Tax=Gabonibacter chumensis TaxID=2972474 RepID=UPI002572F9DA|nr:hypothetical protein [Gabonibacter chumensis]MCR9011742.1 hypothetical protein [Gabonibacter chumensis]